MVVFDWYIGTSVNILLGWCSIKLHSFMHVLVHVLWNYNSRPIKGLSASVDIETYIYNHFKYKEMLFLFIESMMCHSINGKVFDPNRVQARKFFSFNIL